METTLDGLLIAAGLARRITQLQELVENDSVIQAVSVPVGDTVITATKEVILSAIQTEIDATSAQLLALGITLE